MSEAPIIIKRHDGHIVAIGPADQIKPAYHGAQTLTITGGNVDGDRVKLRSGYRDGTAGWAYYPDAYQIEHPQYGTVIAAYVDETPAGLAEAPKTRAILGRQFRAATEAEARANAEETRIIAEGDRA